MTDVTLTSQEEYRYEVINKTITKKLRLLQAATMLGLTTRQIRRLKQAVRIHGKRALIHGLRGKQSNHRRIRG